MFASLRANDLIWPYVVKGYLKGQAPPAFDLLYWNSDDTNLPGPMFCWYVRNTYLENKLREPGATVQCGVPVDLSSVDVPAFVYASKEDHIVPWKTAYASTQICSGDADLRARRQRTHRRRHQPAGEEEAELLDATTAPAPRPRPGPRTWFDERREGAGQLVAGLARVARAAVGSGGDRAQEAGQRRAPGAGAGAGQLRAGTGRLTSHAVARSSSTPARVSAEAVTPASA